MADTNVQNKDIKATTAEALAVTPAQANTNDGVKTPAPVVSSAPVEGARSNPVVERKASTKADDAHHETPNQGPLAAEDWVAVAFVLFAILFFTKVFPKIQAMLDARSVKISNELREAAKLKEEAQALYADAKRKSAEAEIAAVEMVQTAKAEAKRIAEKAETDMNEEAARKMVIVENKIKRAEQQAIESVKKEAVEEATKIATKLLSASAAKNHKSLLSESIAKITSSIN